MRRKRRNGSNLKEKPVNTQAPVADEVTEGQKEEATRLVSALAATGGSAVERIMRQRVEMRLQLCHKLTSPRSSD
jgi:hypothetical protein